MWLGAITHCKMFRITSLIRQLIKDASMTDTYELQREITALYCFVGALASALPLSSRMRLWPAFEQKASQ